MITDLWLDDERVPPTFEQCGLNWTWVKTADEAIEALKSGTIEFVSLDHGWARAFTAKEYADHLINEMDFTAEQAGDIIHGMKNTVNGEFFKAE